MWLCLLASTIVAQAQNIVIKETFLEKGKYWFFPLNLDGLIGTKSFYVTNDTIVDGKTCYIVERRGHQDWFTKGVAYEED